MPYKNKEDRNKRLKLTRSRYKEYQKAYMTLHKEKLKAQYRVASVKRRYNMEAEDYLRAVVTQNNLCAICNRPERVKNKNGDTRPLCVDHCHKSGKVRALLCNRCNAALGYVDDNRDILKAMVEYLKKHSED